MPSQTHATGAPVTPPHSRTLISNTAPHKRTHSSCSLSSDIGIAQPRHKHPCQQVYTLSKSCWTSWRCWGNSGVPYRTTQPEGDEHWAGPHCDPASAPPHQCHTQGSKELLYLCVWSLKEEDQRGPGQDSDTNTAPTWQTALALVPPASPSWYSQRLCLPVATALSVFC